MNIETFLAQYHFSKGNFLVASIQFFSTISLRMLILLTDIPGFVLAYSNYGLLSCIFVPHVLISIENANIKLYHDIILFFFFFFLGCWISIYTTEYKPPHRSNKCGHILSNLFGAEIWLCTTIKERNLKSNPR